MRYSHKAMPLKDAKDMRCFLPLDEHRLYSDFFWDSSQRSKYSKKAVDVIQMGPTRMRGV